MAIYQVTAPDGNSYQVTAPDEASQDDVLNYAKANYQTQQKASSDKPEASLSAPSTQPNWLDDIHQSIADIGQTETETVKSSFADIVNSFKHDENGNRVYQNDKTAGPTWLQDIGQAASPILAAGNIAASPFISTAAGIGGEAYRASVKPEDRTQTGLNISEAAGGALGGVALATAPLLHGAPEVPKVTDVVPPVEEPKAPIIPQTKEQLQSSTSLSTAAPKDINIASEAPTVAQHTGLPTETASAIMQPSADLDISSPNVVKSVLDDMQSSTSLATKGLNAEQTQEATGGAITNFRVNNMNSFTVLDNIARGYSKLNGLYYGRPDVLETAPTAILKNIEDQSQERMVGMLGSPDGTQDFILRRVPGTSQLVKDPTVMPWTTAVKKVIDSGLARDDLMNIYKAIDATNDYANIDRLVKDQYDQRDQNNIRIEALQENAKHHTNQAFEDQYDIHKQIEDLQIENAGLVKSARDIADKQSHTTSAEAHATFLKYEKDPIVQEFLQNTSKLHNAALQDKVDAGLISKTEAARYEAAHPNYMPAHRTIDDFRVDDTINHLTTNVKARGISNVGSSQIDVEGNVIRSFMSSAFKADSNRVSNGMLKMLLQMTDDKGWETLFREPKQKVVDAINNINKLPGDSISPSQVHPFSADRVEQYDTVTFTLDGRKITLSPIDTNLYDSIINNTSKYDPSNPAIKTMVAIGQLKRNLLTKYNPAFAIRNFRRANMESIANLIQARFGRDYVPLISPLNEIIKGYTNKEFYDHFTLNMGLGNDITKGYEGLTSDQIVNNIKADKQQSLIAKAGNGVGDFNSRVDNAIRALQYKILTKKMLAEGYSPEQTHEAAILAAKEVHLRFQQSGADNGYLNTLIKMVPLARAHLNAVDKSMRFGLYAPVALLGGASEMFALYEAGQYYNRQFLDKDGVPFIDKLNPDRKKQVFPIYGPWSKDVNDYIPWDLGWVIGRSMPSLDKSFHYLTQTAGEMFNSAAPVIGQHALKKVPELQSRITPQDLFKTWSDWMFNFVSPTTATPVPVGIAAGLVMNKDAFGKSIIPSSKEQAPGFTQYFPGKTDPAIADFARQLYMKTGVDISPAKAEFIAQELGGAFTSTGLLFGARMFGASQGKQYPEVNNAQLPMGTLFSGESTNIPNEGIPTAYYNVWNKVNDTLITEQTLKGKIQEDPEMIPTYQKFVQENATELYIAKVFQRTNKILSQQQKVLESITDSQTKDQSASLLGSSKKRKQLDAIQMQMIQEQSQVLDLIKSHLDDGNFPVNDIWASRTTITPATELLQKAGETVKKHPLLGLVAP